jgi:energy-coupling factor transport system permease protein
MTTLDSRVWVAWGFAAMLPALVGRNPWLLAEVLLIVVLVRGTWIPPDDAHGMGWFIRIAGVMVALGVVFNLLTVHVGTMVLMTLPEAWPLIGGDLTLNALVYGILSGVALFSLILTGLTMTALVSWLDLFHHIPPRLANVAVTGSVAWTFLPRLAESWSMIREARHMRGERVGNAREMLPLITPLLASSLERALVTAEVLEARGFGGSATSSRPPVGRERAGEWLLVGGLVPAAAGVYCLVVARPLWGVACLLVAGVAIAAGLRLDPPTGPRPTRLIVRAWTRADTTALAGTIVAVLVLGIALMLDPASVTYTTYPDLSWPPVNLAAMAGLALLVVPAFLTSPARSS